MNQHLVCIGSAWARRVWWRQEQGRYGWLVAVTTETQLLEEIALRRTSLRYAFFLNWSRRVPDEVLAAVECVNFHCTQLPFGRGGHPIENLIRRGFAQTVITAHRMTREIDAGPVYCVSEPVSLAGTKEEILGRFVAPVTRMVNWIMRTEPEPLPQTGDPVSFRRLTDEECRAIWAARA